MFGLWGRGRDPHADYYCTRCGRYGQMAVVTEDYAYCAECEEAYRQSMAEEFPYGQCQECGAAGYLDRRGKVRFSHVEGGCSKWTDPADEWYDGADAEPCGVCGYPGRRIPEWPDAAICPVCEADWRKAEAEKARQTAQRPIPPREEWDVTASKDFIPF